MGPISLQLAPETEEDDGQLNVPLGQHVAAASERNNELAREQQQERARMAVATAKERGLELPPMIENPKGVQADEDVGKGMFDGW
jgi:hypothetical protein